MNDFTTAYSKFKGGGKTAMLSNAYYQNLYDIANHSLYLFQDYVRNFTNRAKNKSGRQDSNLRPLGPKPSALPS